MNMEPLVRRFYEAAQVAARNGAYNGDVEQLLIRVGLIGLVARLVPDLQFESGNPMLRLQKLYHVLLHERAMELGDALRGADVRHFFAKGIALLGSAYEPGDRFLADIDIYISPADRPAAIEVARSLGYVELPDEEQAGPPALRSTLAMQHVSSAEIEQVIIDLHWTLDPVERLLPRRDRPLPDLMWDAVDDSGVITVPHPEHHAAVLVHHLVHSDLLHFRSLLDLAVVLGDFSAAGGGEYFALCRQLRIGDLAARLVEMLEHDAGIEVKMTMPAPGDSGNRFLRELDLERWLTMVARSHPDEDSAITVRRIRRRLQLVDGRGAKTLWQDLLTPPAEFLEWRWREKSVMRAGFRHYRQLLRKAVGL